MKMIKNKALSPVIASIMLIALSVVVVGIIWTVVNNLIQGEIGTVESCFGNFDKVTIDRKYTCYDESTSPNQVQFLISIGDIDVDGVLVFITGEEGSGSFTITNEEQSISGLANFTSSFGEPVKLPGKNEGITYIYRWNQIKPATFIEIAPIIKENQCEVSSSSVIELC